MPDPSISKPDFSQTLARGLDLVEIEALPGERWRAEFRRSGDVPRH